MADHVSSAPEFHLVPNTDNTVFERDIMKPVLSTWLVDREPKNENVKSLVTQLLGELEKIYPTVNGIAVQMTEYASPEGGPEEDGESFTENDPQSRQRDRSCGSWAFDLASPSPMSSRDAAATQDWLAAARSGGDSSPHLTSATDKAPGTPDTDETYEPPYELPDYEDDEDDETLVGSIPRIEVDSIEYTVPADSETLQGPVRGRPMEARY